jgi:hypothetical protein
MNNEQRTPAFYIPLRAVSFVALALMAAAIAYTAWISISYWSGIAV